MSSPDYFQILGLERRYHLALDEVERRYHEQSKLLHPDRHARADGATRVKNALATSQLNQAWRTLKDPTKRAEYLLQLEGIEISDERSGHKVPPAFLMEIMELREALADARTERDVGKVAALAADVRGRYAAVQQRIDAGFQAWEAGERERLAAVADAMIAERYFRRFLDEAEAFEEAEQSTHS
jgi:molecular chaperone HscB